MTKPTDAEMIALLPCPFCGGDARLIHHSTSYGGERIVSVGCCAFSQGTESKAIENWNARDRLASLTPTKDAEELAKYIANGEYAGSGYGCVAFYRYGIARLIQSALTAARAEGEKIGLEKAASLIESKFISVGSGGKYQDWGKGEVKDFSGNMSDADAIRALAAAPSPANSKGEA